MAVGPGGAHRTGLCSPELGRVQDLGFGEAPLHAGLREAVLVAVEVGGPQVPPTAGQVGWAAGPRALGRGLTRVWGQDLQDPRTHSPQTKGLRGVRGSPACSLQATCSAEGLGDEPRPGGSAGRGPRSWPSPPPSGQRVDGDRVRLSQRPDDRHQTIYGQMYFFSSYTLGLRLPLKAGGVTPE